MRSLLILAACLLAAPSALPCGGFFCAAGTNGGLVVNQAAERILFVRHDDGTTTAVVQIFYEGEAENFAWILPVPGDPVVGVSSNIALQRLQSATDPALTVNRTVDGQCSQTTGNALCLFCGGGLFLSASPGEGEGEGEGEVQVLRSGQVGPYDYELIQVVDAEEPEALVGTWLGREGYDVTPRAATLLGPYLDEGMNLIAFRLSKDRNAGDIRPVTLRYETTQPMIPIRPTANATQDNMGVLVFVAGPSRAAPLNYSEHTLNPARFDAFSFAPVLDYSGLVNEATADFGGQGFVLEQSGPTAGIATLFREERAFANLQDIEDAAALLLSFANSFAAFDGAREAVGPSLAGSEIDVDEFLECPFCFRDALELAALGQDPAEIFARIDAEVAEPMRQTELLLRDQVHLTRFYTELDEDQMTLDPIFGFFDELPDVNSRQTANLVVECDPLTVTSEAPWRLELPFGLVGRGQSVPNQLPGSWASTPANLEVARYSSGERVVVENNRDAIQAAIVSAPNTCACTTTGTRDVLGLAFVLLLLSLPFSRLYRSRPSARRSRSCPRSPPAHSRCD